MQPPANGHISSEYAQQDGLRWAEGKSPTFMLGTASLSALAAAEVGRYERSKGT